MITVYIAVFLIIATSWFLGYFMGRRDVASHYRALEILKRGKELE